MNNLVVLKNVSRQFGSVTALDDISFTIKKERPVGVVGPNGSGKTTLLSIISGFLAPTAGRVSVFGHEPTHPLVKGRVAILPQDVRLYPGMSILRQLMFFSRLHGRNRRDAHTEACELLEAVGLTEVAKRPPNMLSHGMSKRATIAQAFMGDPELILLDEPTSGIDSVHAKKIRSLIRKHQETSTFLISSHNLTEIENLCDQVIILKAGKVTTKQTLSTLVERHSSIRYRFEFAIPDTLLDRIRQLTSVREASIIGDDSRWVQIEFNQGFETQIEHDLLTVFQEHRVGPVEMNRGVSLEDKVVELTTPDIS